jgi:acetylornithine deacetylase/succinyl-diaminopimelate desuccinylase-like protein
VLRAGVVEEGAGEIVWDRLKTLDPEWRLYGRSSSDDKAPVVGWTWALAALANLRVEPSISLKFFLEGEEEAGSPHLAQYLNSHRDRLHADLWILCDGPVHASRRPQVFFGARGVTGLDLTVYGAGRRLHSGHYGNWAPNPAVELSRLIASIRDEEGRILLPELVKDVRPISDAERRAIARAPPVEAALREELALGRTEGSGTLLSEAILRPAVNVRGIRSGDVGRKTTNSIPTEATVSIDFRLVPDQTPEGVRAAIESFLRGRGFAIFAEEPDAATRRRHSRVARLVWEAGYPGFRTPLDLPVSRAFVSVVEEDATGPIVQMPSLGGSIPMFLFADGGRLPVIGLPIANHDNNQHAANENLRLQNLWDGIEIYAFVFARLGSAWEKAR